MPYLANSPELMIESFSSMPFMKDNRQKGCFSANNLFLKGEGHYHKIEEGLWIILSDFEVKKDLSFKLYYDEDFPADYHYLTLYIDRGSRSINLPKLQLDIENHDRSWALYKAGTVCLNSHFKGQHSIFFSIYFSQSWLDNNISSNGEFKNGKLKTFFESENEYLFFPQILSNKKDVYEHIVEAILDKDEHGVKNVLLLKSRTYDLFASFVEAVDEHHDQNIYNSNKVSERDKRRVLRAQHLLNDAVFEKFPSINAIAKHVGISETKLKIDFKLVTGKTMFQYFTDKQMNYAHELLENENLLIKDVANSLGYASPSKFTQAYKNHFGYTPSEMLSSKVNTLK